MQYKNIFFFGANSDICYELIQQFLHKENNLNFFFFSRNQSRLSNLKVKNSIKYHYISIDLSDREKVIKLLDELNTLPDMIIFFNGELDTVDLVNIHQQYIDKLLNINFLSIVNICNFFIKKVLEVNKKLDIICLSSIAGERGKSNNIFYTASKASLTSYLSSLRQKFYKKNIHVLTVLPGYVKTKMTSHLELPKFLLDDPKILSKKIYYAIKDKKNIYIPLKWRIIIFFIKLIPENLFKKIKFK